MKTETFREKIDLYSADLSRWPVTDVRAALECMEKDPVAKAYFDRALAAEDMLRMADADMPDVSALETRIMSAISGMAQIPQEMPVPPVQAFRAGWIFAPTGGLAAAVLIGFLIGFSPQPQAEILIDPALISADYAITADDELYNGGIF
jgi:hypothetical protein